MADEKKNTGMGRRYSLYLAAGAYLLYLAYDIFTELKGGSEDFIPMLAACIVLGLGGAAVIGYALWLMKKNKKEEASAQEKERAETEAGEDGADGEYERHFLDDY